jgi:CubicO group peptidase (beta-lactamase class C family)
VSGAVVLVGLGDRVILHRAYGYASRFDTSHRELQAPERMTTGHLFDIASLTKVVGTTAGIMLLADRGLLSVDDPVSKHLPAYSTKEKAGITIRHLLTHRSGMLDWYPMYYRASDRPQVHALIAGLPLKSPVGSQRKYSDLGFTVLGQIIEKISGEPLESFLLRRVFLPLGMRSTLYNPLLSGKGMPIVATSHGNPFEHRMVHDPALGYGFPEIDPFAWNGWRGYTLKGEVNDGNAWYAGKGVSGAAGLFSTAEDIAVVVRMLMSGGMHRGKRFLRSETVASFLAPNGDGHGLGWMMDPSSSFMKNAPSGSFGHTGFTGTSIAAVSSSGLYVIILTNRQHRGLLPSREYPNVNGMRQALFTRALRLLQPL